MIVPAAGGRVPSLVFRVEPVHRKPMLKMVVSVVVWLGVLITHTVLLPELEITEREASALDLRKMN